MTDFLGDLLTQIPTVDWDKAYLCDKYDKNYNIVRNCISILAENPSKKKVDMYSTVFVIEAKSRRDEFTKIIERITKITKKIPAFQEKDLSILRIEDQDKITRNINPLLIEELKELGESLRKEIIKTLPYLSEEQVDEVMRLLRAIHSISFKKEELDKMVQGVLQRLGNDINTPLNSLVMMLLERPRPRYHMVTMIEKQVNNLYSNCILFTDKKSIKVITELLFTIHCLEIIGSCDYGKTI